MVVTFHAATLTTGRALPLTRAGLSPAGTRQLCLAHLTLIVARHNEHFCLELARAAGLPAVRTEVQKFGGVPVIIVERFDRYRDRRDKLVKRIHQEDCCQALGVHPNTKYQSEGGPGLPEIMDLLRSTKSPEVDRDRFMRAQVFNFLIGGTDAHAKNYSIIYEPGGAIRLTPLYDVISFLPYQQRRSQLKLAMTIGGRREVDEIRLRHWERAAERCRYSAERIVAHVRELTATLPDLAANVGWRAAIWSTDSNSRSVGRPDRRQRSADRQAKLTSKYYP